MQAPIHFYFYSCYPTPPPPPPQPEFGSGALHGTTPGLAWLPPNPQEPKLDVPVNRVIVAARSWLAGCQDGVEIAAGVQQYAPLLRVQGWTLLIADCGKRGGVYSCA
eukprot:GHRQ01016399.1.p1 GENE.GHRQ01016399.1~~GHRQ01016399.1.p1  ORF type:complete len:107 (-),score=4.41 GHRQ01016399.1:1195-1515(-)